jgi:hypothetical protein
MFIKSFCATLCAVAFVIACGSSAFATNNPIPGIDIIVQKDPQGNAVFKGTTDAKGEVTIKELPSGRYKFVLSGKGTGKGPEPAKIHGSTAIVALLALSTGKEPAARPVTYPVKEGAGGVLQVDIVIPEGPAKSYKLSLTQ